MGYVFNPFIGNFDNAGSGSSTGGAEITHVEYYANLPTASSHNGEYYFVDKDTIWNKLNPLAKTQGGLYRSDGTTWLGGLIPELAGVSDGTNVLVDYPVVFSGVTVDNTAKTVTINSQTDNNLTNALKSTYDGYATNKEPANANIQSHISNTSNPHNTTATQVGLGNVPNLDTTNAVNNQHTHSNKTVLDNTTASFTTTQATNLANQSGTNTGDETASGIKTKLETLTTTNRLSATAIQNLTFKNFTIDGSSYASIYRDTNQVLSASVLTKMLFPKGSCNLNEFDFTNSKFIPTYTQRMIILPILLFSDSSTLLQMRLYENGNSICLWSFDNSSHISTALLRDFIKDYYYEFYITVSSSCNLNSYSSITLLPHSYY